MYKTLHKKQGSVTVQLRFARSSVTFCAKRDNYHRKAAPTDIAAIEDCETELDKISYRAGNAVDKTVVSNENCQYIRDTIDGLKDIWREPVRMYFIEERSVPEISRALGITEEVCRSRISRARKCLKEKLKGLWEQFQ